MPDRITAAWVHADEVAHSWFMSLMGTMAASDHLTSQPVAVHCGTDGLVAARNQVAALFLAMDAEWLWFVDTDMGFAPDTVDRLLEVADPTERPIVGALCFSNRITAQDGFGGYRCDPIPTAYRWVQTPEGRTGYRPIFDYQRDALVEVAATGMACVLIHRGVFEDIRDEFGEKWFNRLTNPTTGQLHGEDLSFCYRAAQTGHRLFVHTGVKTTHLKPIWLQEDDYDPVVVRRHLGITDQPEEGVA